MIEGKIEAIEEEIDELPIVQEFKQSQGDVNRLATISSKYNLEQCNKSNY